MTLPVAGELSPCPHCGAAARTEASASLRWRCAVCGGPLVPTEAGVARSNAELPHLVRSQRARAMALGWTAAAFMLVAVALMAAGAGLLVWFASHAAAIVLAVLATAAAAIAAGSARRARARRKDARVELDAAWERVAREVLKARGGETTAADLAKAMQTDEEHAEHLLSALSVEGRVRVDVRDDAELAYRVEGAEADRGDDAASPDARPGAGARPR